jgi:hypothetical protein
MNEIKKQDSIIITDCPHCKGVIIVNKLDLNCKIFRHGVLKETNKQIDPHSCKETCATLAKEGKIYGCGKPFKLTRRDSFGWISEKCDYI